MFNRIIIYRYRLISVFFVLVSVLLHVANGVNTNKSNDFIPNFQKLDVAYNSTHTIERTVGREGVPTHINEGGDTLAIENQNNVRMDNAEKALGADIAPVNDPIPSKHSSVHARKFVKFLANDSFDTPGDNKASEELSKVAANVNSSGNNFDNFKNGTNVPSNNNLTSSTTKKPHKPLVTNIVNDDSIFIPDQPPLTTKGRLENLPKQNETKNSSFAEPPLLKNSYIGSQAAEVKLEKHVSDDTSSIKIMESSTPDTVHKYIDPLSKAHPNYIIPIVITIFAVPLFGIFGLTAIRRGREAWKNRHYRRMDFLIDGMYND